METSKKQLPVPRNTQSESQVAFITHPQEELIKFSIEEDKAYPSTLIKPPKKNKLFPSTTTIITSIECINSSSDTDNDVCLSTFSDYEEEENYSDDECFWSGPSNTLDDKEKLEEKLKEEVQRKEEERKLEEYVTKNFPLLQLPRMAVALLPNSPSDHNEENPQPVPELISRREKVILHMHTIKQLDEFLEILDGLRSNIVELFIDEEGNRHGKDGILTMIQITFASVLGTTYLLDVMLLGRQLFEHVGPNGKSVKLLLEDSSISKVFFDVRQDSAALYWQYGVSIQGVLDLQLMDMAIRKNQRKYLWGLEKCILNWLPLGEMEGIAWRECKNAGKALFNGDYSKWEERPLSSTLLDYAANDTIYMPHLYEFYFKILKKSNPNLMRLVLIESEIRVRDSKEVNCPHTGAMASRTLSGFGLGSLGPLS